MSKWTHDLVTQAVTWWKEGRSASEISRGLKPLGGSFTRNAVIGKLHRLKHTDRDRPERAKAATSTRNKQAARKRVTPKVAYVPLSEGEALARKRREAREARDAAIRAVELSEVESPNARPWMERRAGECKWPLGERGAIQSCCNPIARGSFCAGHAAVGYDQRPEKRNASGTSYSAHSAIENAARYLTRHEREDHYERNGKGVPHAKPVSIWDEGRAAEQIPAGSDCVVRDGKAVRA